MTTDDGTLLLVGSVARPEDAWSVEDVLGHCASALGEYVTMLPDGEVGDRNQWITVYRAPCLSRQPGVPDGVAPYI